MLLAAIFLISASGQASAQDAYFARWQALHARQPEAISFLISAPKSDFYQGELIPLQLTFTSTQPQSFLAETRLQDRIGRLNGMEEFLVDPVAFVEDPLSGLPGESSGMGGLSGGPVTLSEKPFSFEKLLNEWIRFRKPGDYRITIISRRVAQSGAHLELVSNILKLHIDAAPAAWVKDQISGTGKILDAPVDPNQEAWQRRLRAEHTLCFLGTLEAAAELARHLGSGQDADSSSFQMGLLASPYRKELLPLLEALLVAPDQPVGERYLDTLSRLSELVASGGPMDSLQRRDEHRQRKSKEYTERLIASLPAKRPGPRAISMYTLFNLNEGRDNPTWLPALTSSLIADFHNLPSRMQSNLLENRWSAIKSPAMLPVLREIFAHPPEPRDDPPLQDAAVRRIYDLAPEEGRRLILSQIAAPNTYLRSSTLNLLPDSRLPELNDVLAAQQEAHRYVDSLILRYATGDIVQRIEKAYQSRKEDLDRQKLPHCGGPIIFYFLQYDPAFGEKELRSAVDNPAPFPACYDIGFQFQSLGGYAYSPALEHLAIEFLGSSKVPVKRGAAEVLGKYGSPAAQRPLWDTLEYFHSWWKGREEQLNEATGQEGIQFERALRIALARADSWTLQEEGLNRLLSLCSSKWCRQETTEWLNQASSPVSIQIMPAPDGFSMTIAQYEVHSEEQLRRKVQQFPSGTAFRLLPSAGDQVQQVLQVVRSAGYSITPQ